MKQFLLQEVAQGKYTTWADILYYVVIPIIVFAIIYLVINGSLIKRKTDVVMIVVACVLATVIQALLRDPLGNILAYTEETHRNAFSIFGLEIIKGATITKSTPYIFSFVIAAVTNAFMGLAAILFHNTYVDERTSAYAQGMRAFIASLIVAIGFVVLSVSVSSEDLINTANTVSKSIEEDLRPKDKTTRKVEYDEKKETTETAKRQKD